MRCEAGQGVEPLTPVAWRRGGVAAELIQPASQPAAPYPPWGTVLHCDPSKLLLLQLPRLFGVRPQIMWEISAPGPRLQCELVRGQGGDGGGEFLDSAKLWTGFARK